MIVREARASDAESVGDLLIQLGYGLPVPRLAAKLDRLASTALDAVFVVEEGDRVLGCIGVHAHELLHLEGRLGRITALIVDQGARGRGVGTALMASAERFLDAAGCVKVEVTSGDHRQGAHLFYEARGFRRDERRFLKVLPRGTVARRD